jgi:hypothetical protein
MLVQSFCPKASGFEDFGAFLRVLGLAASLGEITEPIEGGGASLRIGWVADRLPK